MSIATLIPAQQLIGLRSITPEDAGCQDIIAQHLEPLGFIIDICPKVLELGPVNASIHRLNEHIELDALDALKSIYRQVLERLLVPT